MVYLAGSHPRIQAMDIGCLDPYLDVVQMTIKAGVHVMLAFLTGLVQRKKL